MKQYILIILATISIQLGYTQVGINTTTPNSALDVVGDTKLDGRLYLENPGAVSDIRNSKLLVQSTGGEIKKYDIDVSKYGPINYAEFIFRNLSKNGLQDYDTKISVSDYIVTVQGFYYLEAGTGDTDIMAHSNLSNDNIEGFQVYAYANATTGTWFLRAFVNNSEFHTRIGSVFAATPIDMFLNLIIYRRGFISKSLNSISVDMGNSETGTVAAPTGF